MYIFVLRLRNLIQLHGNVWAWLCTTSGGAGGSDSGWAACGSCRCRRPRALLIKATATRASVPWKCLPLRSQGCCPPRKDCRTQGGSRATWPGQARL